MLGDTFYGSHYAPYRSEPPRQNHSSTSRAAAASIAPMLGKLQRRVLNCLKAEGPMTDEEIGERCELGGNTVRPRRCELEAKGLIYDTGQTRRTKSGRSAVLWAAREGVVCGRDDQRAP